MRANEFLNEAGEPENPSRRGFLKGLAGAAATAAMPGGVANLVKTAPAAAPAAAATAASAADLLFQTALDIGVKHGFAKPGSMWDDEDDEEDEWDKELEEPQGDVGEMPWGEYYEMGESPNGVPYLHTADSPDGNYAVFTFIDDGKPQYIVIAWERTGFGEVDDASDPKYMERYNNGSSDWEGDPAEMIDIVMNPANDGPAGKSSASKSSASTAINDGTKLYTLQDKATGQGIGAFRAASDEEAINHALKAAGHNNFDLKDYNLVQTDDWINGKAKSPRVVNIPAAGPSPLDLARLAGIAGKAADSTKQPAPPAQAQQPAPAALPAPEAPNTLEPELNKQKQKVPVNKNASR